MAHSSYAKSSDRLGEVDQRTKAHYIKVAEVMRQFGSPNPQFPSDKDMTFGDLRSHWDVSGLGTILKNMKGKVCSILLSLSKQSL
jgi:hypothetical protein